MEKVSYLLPVRTFVLDRVGQVAPRVYMDWMETGWTHLLTAISFPGYGKKSKLEILPIVVSTAMKHERAFHLGDTVNAEAWVSKITGISVRLQFRFYDEDGALAMSGQQDVLFIDGTNKREARQLTSEAKALFERYLDTSEESTENRKHERGPVGSTREAVGKILVEGQEFSVIVYDESVGGVGVVSVHKLPIREGQNVAFQREQKKAESRVAYITEIHEGGSAAYRIGLEFEAPIDFRL